MRKIILVVLLILFSLVACQQEEANNVGEDNQENATSQSEEGQLYPFTGLETSEAIDQRPIAMMVSNQVQARPQSGLQEADIIFEFLTEGNITRYLALYHSQLPDKVGPIRSAREYFFTLADSYDALYVYSGAANFVNDMIQSREIEHVQAGLHENSDAFFRTDDRVTPHNLYGNLNEIYHLAEEKAYETSGSYPAYSYTGADDLTGEDANYVKIDYYGGTPVMEFTYNDQEKVYEQTMDGDLTRDLETDEPIAINNLFIIETDHEVIDEQQRRKIDVTSGGKAYLLRQGKKQELQWENQDGYIVPVQDGEVIPFIPGKTWISVVQTTPEPGVVEQVVIEQVDE